MSEEQMRSEFVQELPKKLYFFIIQLSSARADNEQLTEQAEEYVEVINEVRIIEDKQTFAASCRTPFLFHQSSPYLFRDEVQYIPGRGNP